MVVVLCTADTDNSGPGRTQVLLLESWGSSHCVLGQAVKCPQNLQNKQQVRYSLNLYHPWQFLAVKRNCFCLYNSYSWNISLYISSGQVNDHFDQLSNQVSHLVRVIADRPTETNAATVSWNMGGLSSAASDGTQRRSRALPSWMCTCPLSNYRSWQGVVTTVFSKQSLPHRVTYFTSMLIQCTWILGLYCSTDD